MSTKKIYTSTYSFTPKGNTTIKPIIFHMAPITNVEWPIKEKNGVNGKFYQLQYELELEVPKKAEFIQIYVDPSVNADTVVIKSSNGVEWFNNSKIKNKMTSIVHVTTSSASTNEDDITVKYILYGTSNSTNISNPYVFIQYGTNINSIGINSTNVIEDVI